MAKTLNESNGTFFMNKNIETPKNPFTEQLEQLKDEKAATEAKNLLFELEKKKQEEIESKLNHLEMIPMYNKVILLPYPVNPYRKIVEGHIIVDYDGSFKNPDTGEYDKMEQLVSCAKVIEVGPEVKYLKVGDDVYYDSRTVYPVPFMSLGYKLTTEVQILCVLNEDLKERFKME